MSTFVSGAAQLTYTHYRVAPRKYVLGGIHYEGEAMILCQHPTKTNHATKVLGIELHNSVIDNMSSISLVGTSKSTFATI